MIIKIHIQMKKFKIKIVHNRTRLIYLEKEELEPSLILIRGMFKNQELKPNQFSLNKIKFQKYNPVKI